jgi:hypothetical protein
MSVSPTKSGGKVHLKTALYTAAGRTKATYLGNKYHRIRELGADCLDRRAEQRIQRSLVHRLETPRHDETLQPIAAGLELVGMLAGNYGNVELPSPRGSPN